MPTQHTLLKTSPFFPLFLFRLVIYILVNNSQMPKLISDKTPEYFFFVLMSFEKSSREWISTSRFGLAGLEHPF